MEQPDKPAPPKRGFDWLRLLYGVGLFVFLIVWTVILDSDHVIAIIHALQGR